MKDLVEDGERKSRCTIADVDDSLSSNTSNTNDAISIDARIFDYVDDDDDDGVDLKIDAAAALG